jgi:hypothetical protein
MARPLHIFVWGPEAPLRRELDQAAPGFLAYARSTATTGALRSPPITASACGVHDADHGPFRRSPEKASLQGKS